VLFGEGKGRKGKERPKRSVLYVCLWEGGGGGIDMESKAAFAIFGIEWVCGRCFGGFVDLMDLLLYACCVYELCNRIPDPRWMSVGTILT